MSKSFEPSHAKSRSVDSRVPSHPRPAASNDEIIAELLDRYLQSLEDRNPISLESLCAEHPELLPEVQRYSKSLGLLHAITPQSSSQEAPRSNDKDAIRLGDFDLVREIGRGGMGVVFEAWQISLHRKVAVKTLPFAAILDPKQLARFQNEARAAALLNHPNIVPVFSVGNDRGTHFYSMQLVDGPSLDSVIRELQNSTHGTAVQIDLDSTLEANNSTPIPSEYRPHHAESVGRFDVSRSSTRDSKTRAYRNYSQLIASPYYQSFVSTVRDQGASSTIHGGTLAPFFRRVAEFGVQAANALHHAHENGIVHRDIKPSNLLIDSTGKLWITDFGLAQCSRFGNLTRTGDLVGTLRFMSPEQANGKNHLVDHRTDIYSLGATLFELATLNRAVEGNDRAAIVKQLDAPNPPSIRRINPAIPRDLDLIIRTAMAKSPDERYSSAEDFARDLNAFLSGDIPKARQVNALERAQRWVRRNSRKVIYSLCVGAGLLIALAGLSWWSLSVNHELQIANANAEHHLQTAKGILDEFSTTILGELSSVSGSESVQRDVALKSIQYLDSFVLYAQKNPHLRMDLGLTHLKAAEISKSLEDFSTAQTHYAKANSILSDLAFHGDDPKGKALFSWSVCVNQQSTSGQKWNNREWVQINLQEAIDRLSGHKTANKDQEKAQSLGLAMLHSSAASFQLGKGETELAFKSLRAALVRLSALDWSDDGLSANEKYEAIRLLTSVLIQFSNSENLSDNLRTALIASIPVVERNLDLDLNHALHLQLLTQLQIAVGRMELRSKNWSSDSKIYEAAASNAAKLLTQFPNRRSYLVQFVASHSALGEFQLRRSDFESSFENFEKAYKKIKYLRGTSDENDMMIANTLHNLAIAANFLGRFRDQEKYIQESMTIQEELVENAPGDVNRSKMLEKLRLTESSLRERRDRVSNLEWDLDTPAAKASNENSGMPSL